MVRALLSAGARADLRDINGRTPLDLLPHSFRAEVGCLLVQQAKEERGSARADGSRVGAPSAPAAVLPSSHYHSASQLQAASEDSGDGPGAARHVCSIHVRGPAISFIWWCGQAQGVWALQVHALLLTRVPEEALGGGRPQGGMPTAAGDEGEEEGWWG